MSEAISNFVAETSAEGLSSMVTRPLPNRDSDFTLLTPLTPATSPSIRDVTFCSTTLAEAPGQAYDTYRVFPCRGRGWSATSTRGIRPAPTTMRMANVSRSVKLDTFISCDGYISRNITSVRKTDLPECPSACPPPKPVTWDTEWLLPCCPFPEMEAGQGWW